jgi:hypothetical protein
MLAVYRWSTAGNDLPPTYVLSGQAVMLCAPAVQPESYGGFQCPVFQKARVPEESTNDRRSRIQVLSVKTDTNGLAIRGKVALVVRPRLWEGRALAAGIYGAERLPWTKGRGYGSTDRRGVVVVVRVVVSPHVRTLSPVWTVVCVCVCVCVVVCFPRWGAPGVCLWSYTPADKALRRLTGVVGGMADAAAATRDL